MEMFSPEAPWKEVAAHTQVFKLYAAYVNHTSQSQIDTVVADLNRRHIAIAIEVGVMDVGTAKTNPPCGGEGVVEGYGVPAMAANVSKMIKLAGGRIRYLVMDEPVFYGHYYDGPHACHSTIGEVLNLVTPTLEVFMQEFPDIVIGEVEPTSIAHREGWRVDLRDWTTGIIGVLRRPLAFIQLDIPWASKAQGMEPEDALAFYRYAQELRSLSLLEGIGIIHDGTPIDTTDASWVADARRHVQLLEGQYGLRPDQDIFQSWMANPTLALPESNPDTLTGLALWYLYIPRNRH